MIMILIVLLLSSIMYCLYVSMSLAIRPSHQKVDM